MLKFATTHRKMTTKTKYQLFSKRFVKNITTRGVSNLNWGSECTFENERI